MALTTHTPTTTAITTYCYLSSNGDDTTGRVEHHGNYGMLPGELLTNRRGGILSFTESQTAPFLLSPFSRGDVPQLFPSLFPLDPAEGQELEAAVEGLVTRPSRDRCPGEGRGP